MSSRDRENRGGSRVAVLEMKESRATLRVAVAAASLIVALVVMVGAMGTPARAAEVSASQMKVSVWPEYDDPRVLVIYQGDLDPSVELPVDATFNIPKGAEIGMACEVDSGGGHACKPYQLVDKGDYQALTYKVEAQHKIFFEYYYDAFPAGADARAFDFIYRPGFAAATTTIEVQEPSRSASFTLDPALSQVTTDSEGFKYHLQDFSALPVDEPFSVKVAYSKTDANPSVKKASSDSAQPGQTSAAGGDGNNNALFIVLAALAFGTLVFGGYRAFRPATATSNRGNRSSVSRPARSRTPRGRGIDDGPPARELRSSKAGRTSKSGGTSKGGVVGIDSKSKFCVSCGTQLRREDRFCSECGDDQS
ncbi:MAG: zinc ribbon domain-containing protein [Thermoleophilia bacterium]